MSILEQARRDLALARSEASRAQESYRGAVRKVREAELRVQRLEITAIEFEVQQASAQRRASAGRP